MSRRRAALPLALLAAACAAEQPASEPPPRIIPGLWEIRSAVTAARGPNLPLQVRNRLVGPRPGRRLCITAAQAADASFLAQRPGECEQQGVAIRNGRLSGAMVCREGAAPPSIVSLDGYYLPAAYVLRMELQSPLPDGTVLALDVATIGRRTGDCEGGDRR